jgi:hypothetical protein
MKVMLLVVTPISNYSLYFSTIGNDSMAGVQTCETGMAVATLISVT